MKLTAIDIQQQQFRKALRGYDRREVENFLELVAHQMGDLIREQGEMKNELRRLHRELDEHRGREQTLREAMLTAQRAVDEIRQQARKEAELIVNQAEMRSEKILHQAQCRVTTILDDIKELKRQRTRALEEIRGILNTHKKLLESYEGEENATISEATLSFLDTKKCATKSSSENLQPMVIQNTG